MKTTITARVAQRAVPFLIVCYLLSFISRINLGFAAVTMNKDLGLSINEFATGAIVFLVGMVLFAIPSGLLMQIVGARRWIAALMIALGIVSGAFAFIPAIVDSLRASAPTDNAHVVYLLRFLLGAVTAGLVPAIIIYVANWSTAAERARRIGSFFVAIPLAAAISPAIGSVSRYILESSNGAYGLQGWQWLLVIEAMPSIAVGALALRYLEDTPLAIWWLDAGERAALQAELDADHRLRKATFRRTLANWIAPLPIFGILLLLLLLTSPEERRSLSKFARTWTLALVYGLLSLGHGAIGLLIAQRPFTWLQALPYALAIVAIIVWTRSADRSGRHAGHLASAAFVAALALLGVAGLNDPLSVALLIGLAVIASSSALAAIWPLPIAFLTGFPAAAGVAFIFAVGAMGVYLGAGVFGFVKSGWGPGAAMFVFACGYLLAALIALALGSDRIAASAATDAPELSIARP